MKRLLSLESLKDIRKDGSFDYGIHPTKFSNIHFLLEDFDEELCNFLENLEDKQNSCLKKHCCILSIS